MTPKEKAKDLYDKMKGFRITSAHRNKCAKVAAQELFENSGGIPSSMEYWNEVLKEIEALKK